MSDNLFILAATIVSGLLGWFMWGYLLPAILKAYTAVIKG